MTGTRASGPSTEARLERVDPNDVTELNAVFADSFTERYRRDGMVGVRVPQLNPAIWRYAIEDAGEGAMQWRNERGEIVAFNISHQSGSEGWMGPLAVRPDAQGRGLGKRIVNAGTAWLQSRGVRVIGLETMPRTMDNIGFYSGLGFVPQRLTITLTLEASPSDDATSLLGRLHAASRDDVLAQCARLTSACSPGVDFTREIAVTAELGLGDTALLWQQGRLAGFALFHTAPLVEGRSRDELRVLKLVLADESNITALATMLRSVARRTGTRRVAIRVQGEYPAAYAALVAAGGRVRWTDLRMALPVAGDADSERRGMVLSNWEI
ncbi:MAG: GNAT family N-acetyltransferase [Gemmatimonadaceae bacterium]